jgi:hypothetical protein
MALTFPSNPNTNQIFQPSGSAASYRWTGTYWQIRQSANPLFGANQSGSILQIDAAGYPVASPITITNGQMTVTASSATSASLATSASWSNTASFATTASSVNTLNQDVTISGSFTVYTGSNAEFQVLGTGVKLGNQMTDRHQVTGSLNITGSMTITGSIFVSGSITGSGFNGTASLATEAVYSKGRYAYWNPMVATNPSGMGAAFTASNYSNRGEDIQLTTTATAGQYANINWSSTNIDWTKDFKAEVGFYGAVYTNLLDTGDGFSLYMGATGIPDTYANAADGGLKFRLFTYNGNVAPNQGGASFYVGSTKGPQGKTNNDWSTQKWLRFTVEVCWDKVTNKRFATAYYTADTGTSDFAKKYFIAGMDVTSWVPGGNNFGFTCTTGGARSAQYINSLSFEAL